MDSDEEHRLEAYATSSFKKDHISQITALQLLQLLPACEGKPKRGKHRLEAYATTEWLMQRFGRVSEVQAAYFTGPPAITDQDRALYCSLLPDVWRGSHAESVRVYREAEKKSRQRTTRQRRTRRREARVA